MIKKNNFYNFNIDLVYLWVDGKNIEWQKEKKYWQECLKVPVSSDTDNCRFIDNQELKYSLRSIAQNAPWINKIFIVTNGQIPVWLNENHPKIKIINQTDIMPIEALPTFNSCAIEACVHNIPGLSEHFLLANDDCFINKKIEPSLFFDKAGKPIFRFKKLVLNQERLEISQYLRSIYNSHNLINKVYGSKYMNLVPHHNIDSYTITGCRNCVNKFKKEFEDIIHSKFRNDKLQRIIIALNMIENKQARKKIVHSRWFKNYFESYCININSYNFMQERILKLKPILLCLNDEPDVQNLFREELKLFLEGLYPDKQPWEKEDVDYRLNKIAKRKYKRHKKLNKKRLRYEFIKSFIQGIFSVVNHRSNGKFHKVIRVLGIKFSIKINRRNQDCETKK